MADVIFDEDYRLRISTRVTAPVNRGLVGFLIKHQIVPNEKVAHGILALTALIILVVSFGLITHSVKHSGVNTQKNFIPATNSY